MTTEAWVQILIAVSIVAVIVLIAALYRLFDVLGDVKETTAIAEKRAKEIDAKIDEAEEKIHTYSGSLKKFFTSLGVIKMVADRFKKKKESKDE